MFIKKYKNTTSIDIYDDIGNYVSQLTEEESNKMVNDMLEVINNVKCKNCGHSQRNHSLEVFIDYLNGESKGWCYTCRYSKDNKICEGFKIK